MNSKTKIIYIVVIISISIILFLLNSLNRNNDIHNETDLTIFDSIFESTENQRYINKQVLLRTMKFMIQETDQDDPELIEFVKSIIYPPSQQAINLKQKSRTDFSQIGQSKLIDNLLHSKHHGFFIEAGGYDGEDHSNSLHFELTRNWTGILIEPIPGNFKTLLSKNRKVFAINACIANNKPTIAKFQEHHVLSGRVKTMSDAHKKRIEKELISKEKTFVYVPCFSISTILKAIEVNTVDYFSLDVEGGENDVLRSIDYEKIFIKTFSIEHNGNEVEKNKMIEHLVKFNYDIVKQDGQDIYFLKK